MKSILVTVVENGRYVNSTGVTVTFTDDDGDEVKHGMTDGQDGWVRLETEKNSGNVTVTTSDGRKSEPHPFDESTEEIEVEVKK